MDPERPGRVREESFADGVGHWFTCRGDLMAALKCLEPHAANPMPMRGVRIRYALLEVYRRLGRVEDARAMVEALRGSEQMAFPGYRGEYLLPAEAKLSSDPVRRQQLLRLALKLQTRAGARLGLVRVALLRVRDSRDSPRSRYDRQHITALAEGVSSLTRCQRFGHVMTNWDAWTMDPAPDETGDYWWGV